MVSTIIPLHRRLALGFLLMLGVATSQEYGTIVSTFSGKCGDIAARSPNNGALLQQWGCWGGTNQQFSFVPSGDYYQIKARHSSKCLGVEGASSARGANVVQLPCSNNQAHLLWSVVGSGDNRQIRASHSGMCMNLTGSNNQASQNGATFAQQDCGQATDKFRVNAALPVLSNPPPTNPPPTNSPPTNPPPTNSPPTNSPPTNPPPVNTPAWDGPYSMPLVAVAAANLADGRILAWSAYRRFNFGGSQGRTYVSIFDPATNLSNEALVQDTQHDMFCPGTATLSDGRIMITGGSNAAAVTFYDPNTNRWSKGDMMNLARGYHSMTVLSDGSVFTLGGSWSGGLGNKHGEVWSATTGEWDLKNNIRVPSDSSLLTTDRQGIFREDNHMWMFTAPNGQVFQAGPSRRMHWIDTSDQGRIRDGKRRSNDDAMNGNAVMYDIGKILTLGGAQDYTNDDATARAYVIDINRGVGQETVKRVGDMSFRRALSTSVILPSGEVVVVGGQSRVRLFEDNDSIRTAEIWNPATEQFTTLSTMDIPRNYHSTALLLNDGRVWAAGGGLCGDCATNHADAEILTPPYLRRADGSLKVRPVIQTAPADISPGDTLDITMDTGGTHSFVLLRLSAATHSVNNDQRRIPLNVKGKGFNNRSFLVEVPSSYSVVVPGTYFLFALNSGGVPSVAKTVVVQPPGNMIPRTTPTMVFPIVSEGFSGHCVDIGGNSQDNGANAIQWPCHGQQNQMFEFEMISNNNGVYRIKAKHSQKCLAVQNAATNQNANVVQQTCQDQSHQLWTIAGTGSNQRLRVTHTNMCLNIFGGSSQRGIELVQRNCVGSNSEMWSVSNSLVSSGRSGALPAPPIPRSSPIQVQIRSEEFSGLCLDIDGASEDDGAPIIQWGCQERAEQLFTFQLVSDGIYRIVAQHSSKCLTIENASTRPGAAVIQQTCQDHDHQLWYVAGGGSNQQLKAKHTNMCLNNFAGSADPGNRLVQWECRGGRNELWHISDALSAP